MVEHVLGHVLLIDDRFGLSILEQVVDDLAPIGLVAADHFAGTGMVIAGILQVVGVEGFVDDAGIGATGKGPHERC